MIGDVGVSFKLGFEKYFAYKFTGLFEQFLKELSFKTTLGNNKIERGLIYFTNLCNKFVLANENVTFVTHQNLFITIVTQKNKCEIS
jgi:hypothetical protein